MPAPKMLTYVALFSARDVHPPCGLEVVQVESRSVIDLDIPKSVYEFYFFDAPDTKEARLDPPGYETNVSPTYVVAKEVWHREKLKKHFAESADFQHKSADTEPVGRMTKGQIYNSVWMAKADSTDYHAICPTGEIVQLHEGKFAIDQNKELLAIGYDRKDKPRASGIKR